MANCLACVVNSGQQTPPGGVIWKDSLWQVDHRIMPCPVLGWLIVKPVRHVEFFDELTEDEAVAFGLLLKRVTHALRQCLPETPEKVYTLLFAESADCPHIHYHVVPRIGQHPEAFRGPRVFGLEGEVGVDAVDDLAVKLRENLSKR